MYLKLVSVLPERTDTWDQLGDRCCHITLRSLSNVSFSPEDRFTSVPFLVDRETSVIGATLAICSQFCISN